MKASILLSLGVIALLLCVSLPSTARADRSMSRARMEKELNNLREALHEAHCELAKRSDRIVELEALVHRDEENGGKIEEEPVAGKVAHSTGKGHRRRRVEVDTDAKDARKGEGASSEKGESKGKENGCCVALTIRYDQNSAVNYEGRETVLNFIQGELEKNPVTLFSVVALANDSPFETTSLDIASNRARFLVDYLVISGIPDDVFVRVEGHVSNRSGAEGRSALVSVESR
ncbi:MAG: hypothetical protein P1U68_07575 [Verrucomicrobiales bacterium]|nr:hypothetical protein [Verrucomicrobiales bacterium]